MIISVVHISFSLFFLYSLFHLESELINMLYLIPTPKHQNILKVIYWWQFEKEQEKLQQIINSRLNDSGIPKMRYTYD